MISAADAKLWAQKWRWYQRNALPWNRAGLHYELARRRAFAKWPLHGDALAMLRDGRLEVGEHTVFEPDVWLTAGPEGRISIGAQSFLNVAVMIAAHQQVRIGDHVMLANGCLVTDSDHRFADLSVPVPYQGFSSPGPTVIEDNVWLGAHVVVTGGVTVGERAVVGSNSVVTRDIPPRCVAAGVPARIIREIDYAETGTGPEPDRPSPPAAPAAGT